MVALVLGIALRALVKRHFNRVHDESGVETNTLAYSLLLLLVLPVMVYLILGSPMVFDYPVLKGFNFKGGMSLSPEFLSLAFALSIYTATYIAEAIRSGIESVSKGQKEATMGLGR
jgi:general L-amino acid transport system permease protein